MKNSVIEVNNFSYSFGNGDVLHSVSFTVEKGEYFSIVGPNGAGKTTLLKNIIRILKGGRGEIELEGRTITSYHQKDLARIVSYVPQPDRNTYPFNVREFVLLSKYPYLNPFSRIGSNEEKELDSVLESTHMSRFKNRHMSTLSSGERQKIMIAASLMQKADILLLDEPTTFLDPKHEEEIHRILKRLNAKGDITIVSVTHNLNSAALLSDRILALKGGRTVYCGNPAGFMSRDILNLLYDKEFELMVHPKRNIKIILPEAI